MSKIGHDCCNTTRKTAFDFLMKPMFKISKIEGYNIKTIKTKREIIQVLWINEKNKLAVRYSGMLCLTSKVALEALCEWIDKGEVRTTKEALTKLSNIKGFKVTKEVEELVREVMSTVRG